jgi:hypothetical protein
MSFEGHTILPSEKIQPTQPTGVENLTQSERDELVGIKPENTSEISPEMPEGEESETEDFEIYTKTGLSAFFTFLKSEQDAKDSLDADLDIAALDLPKGVETSLRQVRMEYADLIRFVSEVLDASDEEVSDEGVMQVHEQYTSYIEAQDTLAELYSAYLNNETVPAKTKGSSEILPDSEPKQDAKEEVVQETKVEPMPSDESVENMQKVRSEIEKDWAAVRHLHDSLHGSFPKEKRGPEQEAVLEQLSQYFQHAGTIRQKASEVDEAYSANLEADLERYSRSMTKVKEQAVQFVQEQSLIYEEAQNAASTEVETETQAAQQESVSDTAAQPESEEVLKSLSETAASNEQEIDYSLAEEKVRELEQVLKNNPAITTDEHQTIQWSIDNLNEKIKSQATESVLKQAIDIADSLVYTEVQQPELQAILEKSKLLTEKARAMSGAHAEEKETANAMVQNLNAQIQKIESGEDVSIEKVQQAYKNVEDFLSDTEVLWLKVCGMQIPQTGPAGVFGARSFRDGLELAKRNHPAIVGSAEKTEVANKIIQLLYVVPDSGLTQAQVDKVVELAKELNISNSTVEARLSIKSTTESSPEEKSVLPIKPSATHKSPAESVVKKSGAMKVEIDEKDDGDIKITVAEKVQEELADQDGSVVGAVEELTHSPAGTEVVAHMERRDIINNSVPSKADRDLAKKESLKKNALVSKYLLENDQYADFFSEYNVTPEDFERQLQTTIKSIDTKEIDFWEAKFDSPYTSAFSYLENMSLAEVQDMNKLSPQERRSVLTQENVKYEAYLAWMDILDPMTNTLSVQPNVQFGELFARWMMETEMTFYTGQTSGSQFTL